MNRHVVSFVALMLVPNLALAQGGAAPAATAAPGKAGAAIPPPPAPPVAPVAPAAKSLSDTLQGPAKASYDAAKILYGDGDYGGALLKFNASFEASKDARLLWNMASCEEKLRHYAKAMNDINRYVAEAGLLLSDQERAEAKALRDTLQGFTAGVTIKVNENDAEVLIDSDVVGRSPLAAPAVADIGERHVTVRKAGFRDFTTTLQLSSPTSLDVTLVKDTHEGRLEVRAPEGSAIKIDGQAMGLGTWSGALSSGGHSLNVSAPKMRTYQTEVTLMDGQTRTVEVTLEPESKTGGIPTWAWITGGVVIAAGAAVGGYFLLKKDSYAPTTAGTIQPGTVELPMLR